MSAPIETRDETVIQSPFHGPTPSRAEDAFVATTVLVAQGKLCPNTAIVGLQAALDHSHIPAVYIHSDPDAATC